MNVLITAATPFEIAGLQAYLSKHFISTGTHQFQKGEVRIALLITGPGLAMTAYGLGRVLAVDDWHLAVNAGICGTLSDRFELGQAVQVVSERFADLGVEEADGRFTHLQELGLIESSQTPFEADGRLLNPGGAEFGMLPTAEGISVNKVHGYAPSIAALRQKYPDAEVESMEGAAFFYACLLEQVPFLEIRAVSNHVAPRNREAWAIEPALEQLNAALIGLVESLFVGFSKNAYF